MVARWVRLFLVCCLWLGMVLQAVPAQAQSQPAPVLVDRAGGDDHQIEVTLSVDRAPGVGEVATLVMTATPALDAANLVVEWFVPEGAELLGGPAVEAVGAVSAAQSVSQSRQMRFPIAGVYKVMAQAKYSVGSALHFSALGVLFFSVNAEGASTVSTIDPNARDFDRTIETEVLPGVTTAAMRAPNGDPCFYISGRITRWDKPPTTMPGYAANVEVPLRHVSIVVREEDDFFDDSYGGGTTNANGEFNFSFCDDDGLFDDELEIYIRVHAEIDFNGSDVVSVEDDGIIDDRWEFNSEVKQSEGGALIFNLRMKDNEQSAIMNIADAVFDAWTVWNNSGGAKGDDAIFDGEAEVHYEPGDGVENSYYSGYFLFGGNVFNYDDISIADEASDPDPWDDSVIIHEWGHMADDYYGCDDNGGGDHFVNQLAEDLELAWGEGYPDYYQAAVRAITNQPNPAWYLDVNGAGNAGIAVDLENYDQNFGANLLSEFNEMAIAAMLWDLHDNNNDARTPGPPAGGPFDSVAHGHAMIQEVYTDPFFESNGDWFDDTCTSFVYLWSWLKLGKPTDSATAEAVTKNNGRTNPFFGATSFAAMTTALAGDAMQGNTAILATANNGNPNEIDHRWWKRLTFVVDNSASMAEFNKFGAVKTVMKETVNDALLAEPKGVEIKVQTFNNDSALNQTVIEGQFRTEGIYPFVDQMATVGTADPGCLGTIDALGALQRGAAGQTRGQVWLYTDTDTYYGAGQGLIRSQLNQAQMRASVALLGGCATSGRLASNIGGEEEDYLQLAADASQSSGIVPYLLTALGTGGQFLYVNSDQLGDAADILRAQLANSAGAGKWSDYVSDVFTYRWDRLEPREYLWIGGLGGGVQLYEDGYVTVDLPGDFPFWESNTSEVEVYQDGYIWMNPCHDTPQLPFCINGFEQYTNILKKDLVWDYIPFPPRAAAQAATTDEPQEITQVYGPQVWVYYGNYQEWYVISTEGVGYYSGNGTAPRAYQVWLNMQTGEVRYLYNQINNEDSGGALISVRENGLFGGSGSEVVVSNQDLAGAVNGGGYKFTPAPPVETRTYAVKADSLIERIGFLQTGYSGAFLPMVVTDPNNVAVTCGSGGVTCYTVDHLAGDRMVQYIEVPNSGPGTWHATIDAASSQATFTFNALAASDVSADSTSLRLRPSIGASPFALRLGRATDDNMLTGWFQSPNGQRFGGEFTLYDDGAHGDGRAGDGRFGLPDLTAPGKGIGYLWVKGIVGGEEIVRSDPVPFNFQPLKVTALTKEVSNDNEAVTLYFQVDNLDGRDVCVNAELTLPAGWGADWDFDEISCQGIAAGGSQTWALTVTPNWPDAASGTTAELGVAFVEAGEGSIQASDTVTFVRRRAPAVVEFDGRAELFEIRPDSTIAVPLLVRASDAQGYPVADGTLVEVIVSGGTIAPVAAASVAAVSDQATIELINGRAELSFTPPNTVGDVTATVQLGGLSDTITLHIVEAAADSIDLVATPTQIYDQVTSSELVVTVKDTFENPVANALVRLVVSDDDGTQGTINGSEAISGTTDSNGQFTATFVKTSAAVGTTWVRAELLLNEGGTLAVKQEDEEQLLLDPNAALVEDLRLPMITNR